MVSGAGRAEWRSVAAPRWPAVLTLGLAGLSVPLALVNPTVSAVLAGSALALALYGHHVATGPARRLYRLAAGIASFAVVLLVVLAVSSLYTVEWNQHR